MSTILTSAYFLKTLTGICESGTLGMMMKTLHINYHYCAFSGAEKYFFDKCSALKDAGHQLVNRNFRQELHASKLVEVCTEVLARRQGIS